jgi:hypothetical protein
MLKKETPMKSKFISTALCLVALIVTFWLIQVFPSEMPKDSNQEESPSQTSEKNPTPDSVSRSFVIETAHDAEDLISTLAYGDNKSYDTELRNIILRLKLSSDYLKDDLADYSGAGYFSKVAEIFEEVISNPFTDSASFSTRVSKMLYELENLYPADAAANANENHPETPMYYPKFDTSVNGKTTLAMLSVFRQQYRKNTGSILLTFGGNLYVGDTLLSAEEESSYKNRYNSSSYSFPLSTLSSILATDTASFANLETPLTLSIGDTTAAGTFKGMPEYATALKKSGLDVVSVANPGVMGFGETGKSDTITALKEASLKYSDEATVCYITTDIGNIAYITYDIIDEISTNVNLITWAAVENDIPAARANGAKIVIVNFNWVNTYKKINEPSSSQVKIARHAVDNGANFVFGSHPDFAEGISKYKGVNIVFSAGNLYKQSETEGVSFLYQQAFKLDADGKVVAGDILLIPVVGGSGSQPNPSLALDYNTATKLEKNLVTWSSSVGDGLRENSNVFGIKDLNMFKVEDKNRH